MYVHVPLPLSTRLPLPLAIASPATVSGSPSTSFAFASSSAVVIVRGPLSSAIAASVTGLVVGASLTALTTRFAVSVAVENALLPPFTVVSAVAPFEPLVPSQARNVIAFAIEPL